jgi:hypothetical protein
MAEWYRQNADDRKAKAKRHRVANVERVRQFEAERYRRDRPKRVELAKEAGHRRRARLAQASRSDKGITVVALRKRDGDRCCLCGDVMDFQTGKHGVYNPRRASIEHLIPINVGGLHVWENVALSCLRCNLTRPNDGSDVHLIGKGNRDALAWLANRGTIPT